jgi:hypothetical protein
LGAKEFRTRVLEAKESAKGSSLVTITYWLCNYFGIPMDIVFLVDHIVSYLAQPRYKPEPHPKKV